MKKLKKRWMILLLASAILAGCSMEGNAQQQSISVYVSEPLVELGNSQQIIIQFEETFEVQDAVLKYVHTETETIFEQSAMEIRAGEAEFSLFFAGDALDGAYQLKSVTFFNEEMEQIIDLETSSHCFSVCKEGTEAEIVEVKEETQTGTENEVVWKDDQVSFANTSKKDVIIVLDPGHDNTHAGAHQNGLKEESLNLKIALYCKAGLEEYYGVKVYMTREDSGVCPYPGRTSARCNEKRVDYAKSVDADIYVSLHNNSSTSSSPKGAIVYYPNTNYKKSLSDTGKGVARKIQDALVALGLYNNGISMKYSADYTYPDGSTADYYGVIRNSKLAGIPAIIVEHAFMSNGSDAQKFLSSDAKLKALGEADAKAIASYYGLSKEPSKPENVLEEMQSAHTTPVPPSKPAAGQVFVDVYEDWYTEYVKYVYEQGLMNGIGITLKFEPSGNITKAQVAQILYNMEGKPYTAERSACKDLKDVYEDWYTDAVCWAYHNGVITGDLQTKKFSPNSHITREQLALMLYRYANYKEYNTKKTSNLSGLKNAGKVSAWASTSVKWAVGMKFMEGIEEKNSSGTVTGYDLKPQGTATRAQMAAILTRFCQSYD